MSRIVLGIGTSHSPLLAIDPALWEARGRDDEKREKVYLADGRVISYRELHAEVGDRYVAEATLEHFTAQSAQAHAAMDALADAIAQAAPDVVIVIGDDQEELFDLGHQPALAVYVGDEVITHPKGEVSPNLPAWYQAANVGYLMDTVHRHRAAPALATRLVEGLIGEGVDVAIASTVANPEKNGFGHAYGFVIDRLLRRVDIPVLPILLNTYFPPNVMRPRRCWQVGEAIGRVLAAQDDDLKVCIIASGGLSHFATDEGLDRSVLDALAAHDGEMLSQVEPHALRSGNSEILNWIMTGGALGGLTAEPPVYIPVYRTPAGTGIGLGFMVWRPQA